MYAFVMACYTAEDVAQLFEEDGAALDSICMEGSDDELGLEEVEIVQNPFYHHVAEFDDFEEIQGRNTLRYTQQMYNSVIYDLKVEAQTLQTSLFVVLLQTWILAMQSAQTETQLAWNQILKTYYPQHQYLGVERIQYHREEGLE